jgi:hypothetical protein
VIDVMKVSESELKRKNKMKIDVEDDQLMKIYQNTTSNFHPGQQTPPKSDTGRYES